MSDLVRYEVKDGVAVVTIDNPPVNVLAPAVWGQIDEAVLYSHPAVRLAAVIGIPDRYHGETVRACIAFKAGATATAEDIIAFCRTSLTGYKVPCSVEVRDTLPMSAVGKILYRVLRAEHATSVAEKR